MNKSAAYAEIGLSTEVESASSHRLIQMLYEKCLRELQLAKNSIEANNLEHRNQAILKASAVVIYLRACLNFQDDSANKLSSLLDENYHLVEKCLLNASLKNDAKFLDMATTVISNIKAGWDEIKDKV